MSLKGATNLELNTLECLGVARHLFAVLLISGIKIPQMALEGDPERNVSDIEMAVVRYLIKGSYADGADLICRFVRIADRVAYAKDNQMWRIHAFINDLIDISRNIGDMTPEVLESRRYRLLND